MLNRAPVVGVRGGGVNVGSAADLVIVANRLPVDRDDESAPWRPSPGGLVTALTPVMRRRAGVWVGWSGVADDHLDSFEHDGFSLVPVTLSDEEVRRFYEGFCNRTVWPLYHDVIVPPNFRRSWWSAYVRANERFAQATAATAAPGATVWVQDYQLQLVPGFLRSLRPDLRIGFFDHIPFPAVEIFAQLPWRRQVLEGLLGADLIGFQRNSDAANFRAAAVALGGMQVEGTLIHSEGHVTATGVFPVSIDATTLGNLAAGAHAQEAARQLRQDLGDPPIVLLGVDRLDYTKGILHRLKAFGELLSDGSLDPDEVVLLQVASPSRERVEEYMALREEVEGVVGRLNGTYGGLIRPVVHYSRQSYPRDDMVSLYLAADVMVVNALRDGMNLVAKEYVASRDNDGGALLLSEFAGAADELTQAYVINPHDIEATKRGILAAIRDPADERAWRMNTMRAYVREHDVDAWAAGFLTALAQAPHRD